MFDLANHDEIIRMVSKRKEGAFLIPLYVNHYRNLVDIRDVGSIQNFNSPTCTLGFGAVCGLFQKYPFPMMYALDFDVKASFDVPYERVEGVMTKYIVFESSIIDEGRFRDNHPMFEQINYYCGMIRDKLIEQYNVAMEKRRQELLNFNQEEA